MLDGFSDVSIEENLTMEILSTEREFMSVEVMPRTLCCWLPWSWEREEWIDPHCFLVRTTWLDILENHVDLFIGFVSRRCPEDLRGIESLIELNGLLSREKEKLLFDQAESTEQEILLELVVSFFDQSNKLLYCSIDDQEIVVSRSRSGQPE